MNKQLKIGFIGGGNMAQAIVRGLLNAGHPQKMLAIADPDAQQRKLLTTIGPDMHIGAENAGPAVSVDVLILAVKPQLMGQIAMQVAAMPRPKHQIIVSVAAGIGLASLSRWFGAQTKAVRVMPNQPALIGAGIAGMVATPQLNEADRSTVTQIIEATGVAIWLPDESLLDAVTAVSGSGPAYFYLLMEMLESAAISYGIPGPAARQLAVETARGSGMLASEEKTELAELRRRVTSPGGTTAAAIEVLESGGIRATFRKALDAARDRAKELGRTADK